mmetsp:Transcript_10321/g.23341  ORF Transcript_10321/g.23341 Transcript_10321/m.23341 type:complete len:271 (-) Transcript_10321:32-844(-)
MHLAHPLVVVDNGHRLVDENLEALSDGFHVVVTASFIAREDSLLHHLFRAVEEEHEVNVNAVLLLERLAVLGVAWEAVDEELRLSRLQHRLFEQSDGDAARDDLPLGNHRLDHVSVLRTRLDVRAQQVSGGEVHDTKLFNKLGTLRSLSASRPTEHEHDVEGWSGPLHARQLADGASHLGKHRLRRGAAGRVGGCGGRGRREGARRGESRREESERDGTPRGCLGRGSGGGGSDRGGGVRSQCGCVCSSRRRCGPPPQQRREQRREVARS